MIVSEARLIEIIEAYGADPESWPEGEREAGLATLQADPDRFAGFLSSARQTDQALSSLFMPEPSRALANRLIQAAPKKQPESEPVWHSFMNWIQAVSDEFRLPVGAALASLMIGLFGGYIYAGSAMVEAGASDDVLYYAFDRSVLSDAWMNEERL